MVTAAPQFQWLKTKGWFFAVVRVACPMLKGRKVALLITEALGPKLKEVLQSSLITSAGRRVSSGSHAGSEIFHRLAYSCPHDNTLTHSLVINHELLADGLTRSELQLWGSPPKAPGCGGAASSQTAVRAEPPLPC